MNVTKFFHVFFVAAVLLLLPGVTRAQQPDVLPEDSVPIRFSGIQPMSSYMEQAATPNFIPPSPESKALNKFLGYPVSHATGLVDVSIPIYTMEAGPVSIPLQLKYHSSGVKTQEAVGTIGRNWTLLPGFRITRTVIGKPDELFPVTLPSGNVLSIPDQILLSAPAGGQTCSYLYGAADQREIDGQYDLFTLHLPHTSVSFIIQGNSNALQVRMSPERPLTIKPLVATTGNTRLYGFDVTDENGVKYTYGEATSGVSRGNFSEHAGNPHGGVYSAWILREVVLPDSQKISFTYLRNEELVRNVFESEIMLDSGISFADRFGSGCPFWPTEMLPQPGYRKSWQSGNFTNDLTTSLIPVTIVTPHEKATFTYGSHTTGAKILTSIQVTNNANQEVKRATLTQNPARLLSKVALTGEGSYTLNYKNGTDTTIDSKGFDWWGYYNGCITGGIPIIRLTPRDTTQPHVITFGKPGVEREPAAAYMDTRSLQEVIYPTGGKLNIEYEPHRFTSSDNQQRIGAGLRVKSTRLYDPVSGKTITRTYTYEGAEYPARVYPTTDALISETELCQLTNKPGTVRQRTVSMFPLTHEVNSGTTPVWYNKVTENSDNGRTVYQYAFRSDSYSNQWDLGGMYQIISSLYRMADPSPRLVNQTHYKKEGTVYTKTEETIHTYSSRISILNGLVAVAFRRPIDGGPLCDFAQWSACHNYRWYDVFENPVRTFEYTVAVGNYPLTGTEKRTYTGSNYVSEKTSVTYDTARPYNVTEKRTALSDGTEQVEKFYYTNHTLPGRSSLTAAQQTAISQMDAAGYRSTVIEKEIYKGTTRLQSLLAGYKRLSATLYVPETVYYRTRSNGYEARTQFSEHDKYGNPRYVVKDGTEKTVCIWGYKGRYPVAVARNITYAAFTGKVSATILNAIAEAVTLSTSHASSLNTVRTSVNTAHVTTFEYKPSVGIMKATDPRGIVTNYTYDTAGRLTSVKNDGGRQDYIYNYVNN